MSAQRIAVVGGGLAGITAALDAARGGAEVTLLESRGRLGGAAYSFTRWGMRLDNGQHVFLRCCSAYIELLEQLGAAGMVTVQPRLRIPVLAGEGRRAMLRRSNLPAPLHLAGSLARFAPLSVRDRVAVARAMNALRQVDVDDPATDRRAFGDWLAEHGQSPEAVAGLWELIARPTLNLAPPEASLAQAAQVFQVGLLSAAAAADIGYAQVPLSDIHDVAARRTLAAAGVEVRLRHGATAVARQRQGFAIEVSGARTLETDTVILAVPPDRAARLLPPGSGIEPHRPSALGRSPIVNLHVVYDRPVLDEAFAVAVHSPVQWLFDRSASSGVTRGQYLAISLSAAEHELSLSVEELRGRYIPELARVLGQSARVDAFFVTREHSATFRAAPGARALRPGPNTQLAGLLVAGTWTDTGWPATMESAVRSGHAAARAALEAPPERRGPRVASRPARPSADGRGAAVAILAPISIEARALRSGAPWADVRRVGIGPRRAGQSAPVVAPGRGPVVLAGFCGALDERLAPGDVVVASELRCSDETLPCPDPTVLAGVLRRGGLRVHVGALACSARIVTRRDRVRWQDTGALAVDMESAAVAKALCGRDVFVIRVVSDTASHELHRPLRVVAAGVAGYRSLKRVAASLQEWTRALHSREIVLATPRASCAGVERAVGIVERVLEEHGPPVYVRKQIVHNAHVIAELERRGAVFVDEIDQIPAGATVIFSAHGVSPAVRAGARERELRVIDATCPLVAKVHAEARRFSACGFDIVLVGHEGHEEVEGTYGEAPARTHVVATAGDVANLRLEDPGRVAYLTQTTLAQDDTANVIEALRERFPQLVGPRSSDICYATQNRQDAVRALADDCDLVLVIGSGNSSNSRRLVEVARRAGARAVLIEDGMDLRPEMLAGVRRVGVTAGASAPEELVQGMIRALSGLGDAAVTERRVATEDVHFKLPVELRGDR